MARSQLDQAQDCLFELLGEEQLRERLAQVGFAETSRAPASTGAESEGSNADGLSVEELLALVRERFAHNRAVSEERPQVIKPLITGALALTVVLLIVFAIGNGTDRGVLGLGGLAGMLAGATSIIRILEINLVRWAWMLALLKFLVGPGVALIAVILLQKGFGALEPATGRAALFYALAFGFTQQLITGRLDVWLERHLVPKTNPGPQPDHGR